MTIPCAYVTRRTLLRTRVHYNMGRIGRVPGIQGSDPRFNMQLIISLNY
jgi:hypothetical protein